MIQCWLITPPEQMTYRLDTFKRLTDAVLAFRRDEFQQERLAIQRERLELLRDKQRNKSESSASSHPSSSPDRRSTDREVPEAPKPPSDAQVSAEPAESAPKQPEITTTDPAPPRRCDPAQTKNTALQRPAQPLQPAVTLL